MKQVEPGGIWHCKGRQKNLFKLKIESCHLTIQVTFKWFIFDEKKLYFPLVDNIWKLYIIITKYWFEIHYLQRFNRYL